ncbi:MAG: STAS domain-containing protein [Armatimonadetes bacterium]|nr:STAS domain-containing protein [Armatimonadota bacterium]
MGIELQPLTSALRDRVAVLRFTGVLSLHDVAELKSSLKRLLRDGIKHLLLDLENVRDIDEAGWALLVSTVRKLRRQNGQVVIRQCPDDLYEHLKMKKWDRDFLFPMRFADHLAALPKEMQAYFSPAPALAPGSA